MTKIRDLIPKTALDKWNGENYYISKLESLDNEPTLWINLINKSGSIISIAFDFHEGVEIKE
jgi:hypothetical protein